MYSLSQSTVTTFSRGSLIIAMDNAKQNLSASVAFNIKAYGLVNVLLQNNIPVHWAIRDDKAKDEADFTVSAGRIYPSATTAALLNFRSGPFIIDSIWVAKATPFITAYGNNVAVYRANAAFSAPIRYEITWKPKIAVFTNGNSASIHTKALRFAGFTSPAHFDSMPAQNINNAGMCYTIGFEPHWSGSHNPAVTAAVTTFLNSGGNFLAQCAGIDAYEEYEHHHTTQGIDFETSNNKKDNTNLYSGVAHPLMQFEGQLTNDPTGNIVNFKNNGGTYQPLTSFLVKKNPLPASGVSKGDVVLSTRKVGAAANGGNVTYLGGHDYLKSSFDLLDLGFLGLDFARANDVTWNNGLRIFCNSIFMPSTRATACNFVFAADVELFSAVNNNTPCPGATVGYTVSATNNGPGTANGVIVKTDNLPAGLAYVSNSPSQGSYNSTTREWAIGNISPSQTVTLTISYSVSAQGSYTLKSWNTALIASNSLLNDTTSLNFASDQVPPQITAPAAISTTTTSGCSATGIALGTPITSDNCGVAAVTNNAPSTFPIGTTAVTWSVTDNSGNTASATQIVTVTDSENPTITAPAAVSTTTTSGCSATGIALGTPTTTDNCSVVSVTNNAPSTFPIGTTTVTWTVTDNAGNTASSTQTVTVTDAENPTITAPAAVSTTTTSGCSATGIALGTPVTSDNCGVAAVTNNAPSSFSIGTTTVTWTVTDNSGNTASATQTVTVTDNEAPLISSCGDTIISCFPTVTFTLPFISDNCGSTLLQTDGTGLGSGSVFPEGFTSLTYEATDISGNTAVCTKVIRSISVQLSDAGENRQVYTNEITLDAIPVLQGEGTWTVVSGNAVIDDDHSPDAEAKNLGAGENLFSWQVSNEGCVSEPDTVTINFAGLNIPNGFSPDGDNVNDFFEIEGITGFSPAELHVFNRWGTIVYQNDNYQNEWDGSNSNGEALTDDTYYYTLILNGGTGFSGFIMLERR